MRKILILIASLMFAWCNLYADSYLYWMVDEVDASLAYEFCILRYVDEGGNLGVLTTEEGEYMIYADEPTPSTTMSHLYAVIPSSLDREHLLYYVELYNEDSETIAITEAVAWNDIKAHVYDSTGTGGALPYHFSTASVPEPSGALLSLIGFGLLALRRRREKV